MTPPNKQRSELPYKFILYCIAGIMAAEASLDMFRWYVSEHLPQKTDLKIIEERLNRLEAGEVGELGEAEVSR